MVRGLYDNPTLSSGSDAKKPWLEKLKAEGVFLLDLATVPVNELAAAEREAALARNIPQTVSLASDLRPDGIVLLKQNVFDLLEQPIRDAGLPLFNDAMIPFPGSGQQKRFRKRFADALARPERENRSDPFLLG